MAAFTRRRFLKHASSLAALAALSAGSPLRLLAAPPLPRGDWPDLVPSPGTRPRPVAPSAPAALPSYQLQNPLFAFLLDLTAFDHQARFNQLVGQGYRQIWVQGGPDGNGANDATISSIYVRDGASIAWEAHHNMTSGQYQTAFTNLANRGFRPICVSGYAAPGGPLFAAIWISDPGTPYAGIHEATGTAYQNWVNTAIGNGYRPIAVDGYASGVDAHYIAVWGAVGPGSWVARHGLTSADYQTLFNTFVPLGYFVEDVGGYEVNGTTYFTASMFQQSVGAWVARHDEIAAAANADATTWARSDFYPTVVDAYETGATRNIAHIWIQKPRTWTATGPAVPALAAFDSTMQSFMQQRSIRSGSLAVTKDGRLVLARGYSWDNGPDAVQPDSLFRIASLTKAITAAAVMRLVQDGVLHLSDRMVDILHPTPPLGQTADARLPQITVYHLLHHQGGWDRTISPDPMFLDATTAAALGRPLPITQADIITYQTGQALNFIPGTQYQYSNYGYCLLGRIIEAVTGLPYGLYVRKAVLDPLHIKGIQLGATDFSQRAAGEVAYYTQQMGLYPNVRAAGAPANAMLPYGAWNLENMDSHGGWLASAVALARFLTAFDTNGTHPVLTQATIDQIFAQSLVQPDGSWYGCGWAVRNVPGGLNTWHNGSLDGTSTLMVRRFDGVSYAVLFNQRDDPSGLDYGQIDPLLYSTADGIASWPANNLFLEFGLPAGFTYLPSIQR